MSKPGLRRLNRKKHLWKLVFASTAIRRVLFTCEFLQQHIQHEDDPLYYPLITAVCVTYAKPFTDNQGVGMLSGTLARFTAPELHAMHECLIRARNLFYAHSDATHAAFEPESGASLKTQVVCFRVQYVETEGCPHPIVQTGMSEVRFRIANVPTIKRLCDELLEKIEQETEAVLKELFDGSQLAEGWHEVSIDDES